MRSKFLLAIVFVFSICFPLLSYHSYQQGQTGVELDDFQALSKNDWNTIENFSQGIVTCAKRIEFPGFPRAFNPSFIKVDQGFLFIFRTMPDDWQHWVSHIGVVLLDEEFKPLHAPKILDTRCGHQVTPSQSEDARLFSFQGKIYLIYNDNREITCPSLYYDRRDMYLAELMISGHTYTLGNPLKLIHEKKYDSQRVQKNWIPFEWQGKLLLAYTMNPHEILVPDLNTGICKPLYESHATLQWGLGTPRGSSIPVMMDGEYFAIFHSGVHTNSPASGWARWHYFMGAYAFSPHPPFELTKMTPLAITAPGFYVDSGCEKRVIFPGGAIVLGDKILVAYGRDDCEMWIATLNKDKLKKAMWPIAK